MDTWNYNFSNWNCYIFKLFFDLSRSWTLEIVFPKIINFDPKDCHIQFWQICFKGNMYIKNRINVLIQIQFNSLTESWTFQLIATSPTLFPHRSGLKSRYILTATRWTTYQYRFLEEKDQVPTRIFNQILNYLGFPATSWSN